MLQNMSSPPTGVIDGLRSSSYSVGSLRFDRCGTPIVSSPAAEQIRDLTFTLEGLRGVRFESALCGESWYGEEGTTARGDGERFAGTRPPRHVLEQIVQVAALHLRHNR